MSFRSTDIAVLILDGSFYNAIRYSDLETSEISRPFTSLVILVGFGDTHSRSDCNQISTFKNNQAVLPIRFQKENVHCIKNIFSRSIVSFDGKKVAGKNFGVASTNTTEFESKVTIIINVGFLTFSPNSWDILMLTYNIICLFPL